jgi:Xaa-Pro dipeptidase
VEKRVKRIFDTFKTPPDIILIKNATYPFIDLNFFYITGLEKGIFEGCLTAIYPDNNIELIISNLEEESAKKANIDMHIYKNKREWDQLIKTKFSSFKNIGLNFFGLCYRDFSKFEKYFPKSRFIDVSENLRDTRLIKDETELKHIKKACSIADEAMGKIPDILQEGMYEYEIAAEIDYIMQKLGAEKPAFETISSFNANTAEPHYSHGGKRLKKGNFALFDIGASVKNYNSDMTRTMVCGKANKKQKEMYSTVFDAQQKAFEIIKPNVKASDIHNKVNSYIDKTKFKGCFIHSTGHSLGLSVHDGGRFSSESKIIVKENMVFTVEPGIYIPGFGGVRIEDDILVTEDGFELLTNTSRELLEI